MNRKWSQEKDFTQTGSVGESQHFAQEDSAQQATCMQRSKDQSKTCYNIPLSHLSGRKGLKTLTELLSRKMDGYFSQKKKNYASHLDSFKHIHTYPFLLQFQNNFQFQVDPAESSKSICIFQCDQQLECSLWGC